MKLDSKEEFIMSLEKTMDMFEIKRGEGINALSELVQRMDQNVERLEEICSNLKNCKEFSNELEQLAELLEEFEGFRGEFYFISSVRTPEEIGDALGTLIEFIWYERHKVREMDIADGIEVCDPNIWKQAQEQATKLEKKYDNDILVYDDFEWGMRNGKLSALRWLLGEEWDTLDT